MYADRYSGWVEVAKLRDKKISSIRECMLRWFALFGVPEGVSSDGGPPFNSSEYTTFLRTWDIQRRLSSAHYPQSNGRAEAAVKSAKRTLSGNIDPRTGQFNTEDAVRALLTDRNTPAQDMGVSPAVALFGHPIRDHLPDQHRALRPEWQKVSDARELALARRHVRAQPDTSSRPTLQPLTIGQSVQIQNQSGNRPLRWSNTGIITEVLPYRQYKLIVDGSRRITLRNRRFLRPIEPVLRRRWDNAPSVAPEPSQPTQQYDSTVRTPERTADPSATPQHLEYPIDNRQFTETTIPTPSSERELQTVSPDTALELLPPAECTSVDRNELSNPVTSPFEPRRSTRDRRPRRQLSPTMSGMYHRD